MIVEEILMARSKEYINVYLEIGQKITFAAAIDFPGWCRSGRDELAALDALFRYSPRYALVLRLATLGFQIPTSPADFHVQESLSGTTTTDFGSPAMAPSDDSHTVSNSDLERFHAILSACWQTFEGAVKTAEGKPLRKGPRGGGRELDEIVAHVRDVNIAYLAKIGWKISSNNSIGLHQVQQEILNALSAAILVEGPTFGPRGGERWSPRYFIRRVAWHILDHAWEIEDRITPD